MPQAGRDITGRIFNHSTLDYVWKFIHLSTLIIASIPACSRKINMKECTPAQCFLGFVGGVKHIWSRGQHCYTVMLMVGQWTVGRLNITSRHRMHLIFAKHNVGMSVSKSSLIFTDKCANFVWRQLE